MIKTVLFDFDGVIADSLSSIYNWFQYAAKVFDVRLPVDNLDDFADIFFEPFPEFYKHLGFNWDEDLDRIYEEYVNYHSTHPVVLVEGIDDVIKSLAAIPHIRLGIVSSNITKLLHFNLDHHKLSDCFHVVKGADKGDGKPLKPDPTLLIEALSELGSDISESVYIGDQPSDVLAAHNATQALDAGKMQMISVTTGFANRRKLEKADPRADYIIDHPLEILEKLEIPKN